MSPRTEALLTDPGSIDEIVPWLQEAIAHFYPNSEYAASLDPEVEERAVHRLFLTPKTGASAICPHCGAPHAVPCLDELIALVCPQCGQPVKVEAPKVKQAAYWPSARTALPTDIGS